MTTLPDKPSDLIELALRDLAEVESMPEIYKVGMGHWHENNVKCEVCFAGAVIARTLHTDPKQDMVPGHFSDETRHKLLALDEFRSGYICIGLCAMNISLSPPYGIREEWKVQPYSTDTSHQFHADMQSLADYLRSEGL